MISILIPAAIVIVGFAAINSQADENRKIPPASTKEGKKARAIIAAVVVACFGSFAINIIVSKKPEDRQLLFVSGAIGVIMALLFVVLGLRKNKHHKK